MEIDVWKRSKWPEANDQTTWRLHKDDTSRRLTLAKRGASPREIPKRFSTYDTFDSNVPEPILPNGMSAWTDKPYQKSETHHQESAPGAKRVGSEPVDKHAVEM